ncbi:MAG: PspC domain-containing protein [Chloroflexota bacterium]|nr:PspC domain-containing protein [Chloroflexota bacterium]
MSNSNNKLRRSHRKRVIAGVCGGLGEFFGICPFWF